MARGSGGLTVNRQQLAEIFGISLPTVNAWLRAGCPYISKGSKGKTYEFDTAAVAQWRADQAAEAATGDEVKTADEWRTRKLAAEAQRAELELLEARKQVAPIAEFERVQAKAFAMIRQNVMTVPQRAVLALLGETDETRFKQVLARELTEALQKAAAAEIDLDEEEKGDDA